jgi:hypothetical protein
MSYASCHGAAIYSVLESLSESTRLVLGDLEAAPAPEYMFLSFR